MSYTDAKKVVYLQSIYKELESLVKEIGTVEGTSTTWNSIIGDQTSVNLSGFTNDAGFITAESDPTFATSPAASITQPDINSWNTSLQSGDNISELTNDAGYITTQTIPTLQEVTAAGNTTDIPIEVDSYILSRGATLNGGGVSSYGGVVGYNLVTDTFRLNSRGQNPAFFNFSPISDTEGQTFTFPDKSGTIALLDDVSPVQSVNSLDGDVELDLTFSAGALSITGGNTVNLDTRYYSIAQLNTSGSSNVHWNNITNKPAAFTGSFVTATDTITVENGLITAVTPL